MQKVQNVQSEMFDKDHNNEIHTLAMSVSQSAPFSVLDLWKTITSNQMIHTGNSIYHHYCDIIIVCWYVGNDMNFSVNVPVASYQSNAVVKFDSASFQK